jgi:hypothetical protein
LGRDGRGRAVIEGEQSKRLGDAVARRQAERGWVIGQRVSSSTFYKLTRGAPSLLGRLPEWSRRMRWTPQSAQRVALDAGDPTPLELLPARLRQAVEVWCADHGGQDAAVAVPEGMWTMLAAGRLPGMDADEDAFYDALYDALSGEFPAGTLQALRDLDGAMGWVPGSSERVLRTGAAPVPLGASRLVIDLDGPPGAADLDTYFQVAGRLSAVAPQMTPEDRGRLTAVLRWLLNDWTARQGS